MNTILNIGDSSDNGQITIIDEDRLCYLVKSTSRGAYGIRTISKKLLEEYVEYFGKHPDATANDARDALSGLSDIDKFEYSYSSTLRVMALMALGQIEKFTEQSPTIPHKKREFDFPLQQIFYGAPGTGKSHEIKKLTKGESVIRTTFHPDSDYSTFVGCYKPTMDEVDTQVVPVVVKSGISLQDPGTYKEKRITYKFVMQAFLKAYLGAWKKWADAGDDGVAPQFLVIEEINRGNCAQIFGDLFQLLDRSDNNFSEYPIEADTDLQQEIERAFKEHKDYKLTKAIDAEGAVKDYISNYDSTLSEDIQSGRILLLPPNLYIWATMNTSDQSLFPIDSAFKRRWEWKYIKIAWPYKKNEDGSFKTDENGEKVHFNYTIEGGHDWWAFLQQINAIIDKMTNSADKQLGYFFAKAKDDIISYDTFVSKVCFYLWNDIFKTYALDEQQGDLFKFAKIIKDKDENEKEVIGHLSFPEFYDGDGNVVPDVARQFIEHVMAWNTESKKENS